MKNVFDFQRLDVVCFERSGFAGCLGMRRKCEPNDLQMIRLLIKTAFLQRFAIENGYK
jgi:hypothetical protein